MIDWIKHDGGPQPVADNVWVEDQSSLFGADLAEDLDWDDPRQYRIVNQHLIDAARLEGIRIGLEAAVKAADAYDGLAAMSVQRLDPETIAREAALDQLTSEAQADNMGYDTD